MTAPAAIRLRLAELVAVLSLGTDLGLGQPMEHVIRQTLIGLRLAERLGLDDDERRVVYYTGLLAFVGCHVDAHEQARWFGDDLSTKGAARLVDFAGARDDLAFVLERLGSGGTPLERVRLGFSFVRRGWRDMEAMFENHWQATDGLATSLALDPAVRSNLQQTFDRWDGRGLTGARGEEIGLPARLIVLADVAEVFHRSGGPDAALDVARRRRGTQFDPELVDLLARSAADVFEPVDAAATWERVIEGEPTLGRVLTDDELERALEAIADFVDLKCPHMLGHSRAVGDLAGSAARQAGLPEADARLVRRAGLVHDIGRLGVSNAIWDKRAPLTRSDWERIRLHPYLTERMLASVPALAPLGALAARHRERLDGSGYPRGVTGDALSPAARVLAAADAYVALTSARPYRAPHSAADAAGTLRAETRAGRLDGQAVDAVLAAAGHRVPRRREWPAGLTTREVEVLRLVARGLTTREIAKALVISPKTARNHVEHIYAKADVANRAQASLFAVRTGLLVEIEPDTRP